jgi:HAD superfamily hydrolase (TIGR01509 family)
MLPLDAILFDLGGTLDGRGGWRERFHQLLSAAGIASSRDQRIAAFDYAERQSHSNVRMAVAGLRELVSHHVEWQLASLGIHNSETAAAIGSRFLRDVETAAAVNRPVLARLAAEGYRMAVVSNGCGNAARICEDLGYAPMLTDVIDSHVVGFAKPDPAIFRYTLRLLGAQAERAGLVGDTLDRDMQPAKALGMTTFWVAGDAGRADLSGPPCASQRSAVDYRLDSVVDLPAALQRLAGGGPKRSALRDAAGTKGSARGAGVESA